MSTIKSIKYRFVARVAAGLLAVVASYDAGAGVLLPFEARPGIASVDFVPVDNSAALSGFVTQDLVVQADERWLSARVAARLTAGSIYQDPLGMTGSPPGQAVIDLFPTVAFDSYVQSPGGAPAIVLGSPAFENDMIDIPWGGTLGEVFTGQLHLGRFTFTDDARGEGFVQLGTEHGFDPVSGFGVLTIRDGVAAVTNYLERDSRPLPSLPFELPDRLIESGAVLIDGVENNVLVRGDSTNVSIVAPADVRHIRAHDRAAITHSGGAVGFYALFDDASLTVDSDEATPGDPRQFGQVFALNRSHLTMAGGVFRNGVVLRHEATAEIKGGRLERGVIRLYERSSAVVPADSPALPDGDSGARVTISIILNDHSRIDIAPQRAVRLSSTITARGRSRAFVHGFQTNLVGASVRGEANASVSVVNAQVDEVLLRVFSRGFLHNARVAGDTAASHDSRLVFGGDSATTDRLIVQQNAIAGVYGGSINEVLLRGDAVLIIEDGTIGMFQAEASPFLPSSLTPVAHLLGGVFQNELSLIENAIVHLSGGVYVGPFDVLTDSTLHVYGSGFNFPDGPIPDLAGTLTGTLFDGTPISVDFTRDDALGGRIILNSTDPPPTPPVVPEPGALVVVSLAGLLHAGMRRRAAMV